MKYLIIPSIVYANQRYYHVIHLLFHSYPALLTHSLIGGHTMCNSCVNMIGKSSSKTCPFCSKGYVSTSRSYLMMEIINDVKTVDLGTHKVTHSFTHSLIYLLTYLLAHEGMNTPSDLSPILNDDNETPTEVIKGIIVKMKSDLQQYEGCHSLTHSLMLAHSLTHNSNICQAKRK